MEAINVEEYRSSDSDMVMNTVQVQDEVQVVEYGFGDILNIGLIFVVSGLVLAYGTDIVDDVSSDFTANSAGANVTGDVIGGIDALSSKMPTLGKIAIAAIIIGVLVGAFAMRR